MTHLLRHTWRDLLATALCFAALPVWAMLMWSFS